ncbi:hypothetical protein AC1031_004330 [Aphanomyces cochlioides]|nr:hypothetical protein AC1031_004330 [Aphanomyces cochlioides]
MGGEKSSSARWTKEIDLEFLQHYAEAAGQPHFVASGGKSLKASGWNSVLAKMSNAGNISSVEQLKTRWRRMKEDYSDFHWLPTQHSGGSRSGMTSAQWAELDTKGKKHKLSRFRYIDFPYNDIVQRIVGDTIGGSDLQTDDEAANIQTNVDFGDFSEEYRTSDDRRLESSGANLTAAQNRARLVNDAMKKNRKRKAMENEVKLELKRRNADSLASIAKDISNLVQLTARKQEQETQYESD